VRFSALCVVEYELDRRIGWEPEAGRGHPGAAAGQDGRHWGQRWSYELVPERLGPGAAGAYGPA